MSLGEIEPIAFVKNRFHHNGKIFEHLGIAFSARLRNQSSVNVKNLLGRFVNIDDKELESINRYANREVARLCNKRIEGFETEFPENEISTNEKYRFRYLVHDKIVKKFLLTPKLKRKEQLISKIREKNGSAQSLLDVSCGDSDLIYRLGASCNFDYIVGNDVSWGQINTKHGLGTNIIFTNHNASYLPFKDDAFDVLYCGNTLHHMASRQDLEMLFSSCLRVARKIIFLEIEKPDETGWLPRVLNTYWYRKFLGDPGGAYLNQKAFRSILETCYGGRAVVAFDEFKNIQGRYMIAEVTKKSSAEKSRTHLEVEEKFYLDDPSELERRLAESGFTHSSDECETDDYFTDPSGKFVVDRTCLRIRTAGARGEVTFKGKSHKLSSGFAKVERNVTIDPKQAEDCRKLLGSLGYDKYVSVVKRRRTYHRQIDGLEHTVAIDFIQDVGSFVEFEITVPVADWQGREEQLKARLSTWLEEFGAGCWTKAEMPYRDFVAGHIKKSILKSPGLKVVMVDFDGTLAPSEILFYRAYRDAVASRYGYSITLEEYKEFELSESDGLFPHLQKVAEVDPKDKATLMEDAYRRYDEYTSSLLTDDETMTNLAALSELRKTGVRLALVTTSKRQFISKVLEHFGCENIFETIVCREDVATHKPDPAAFHLALEQLRVSPNECLVFEDSRRGVTAAKAAGLDCVGVYGLSLTSKDELASLGIPTLETLTEAVNILRFA
jgi:predicted adenylyl cyclase CyaB